MTDMLTPAGTAKLSSPIRMTFEEYLTWDDEGQRAEWVAGELVFMSPVNIDHQRLINFLNDLIKAFIWPRGLGETFFAPVAMRLAPRPSGREPDLMFISTAHADRLKPTHVDGPADLVVEIVSPDTVERDYTEKLREYEAGGVAEYWVVDAMRQVALFFQMGQDGRYQHIAADADGLYYSAVLPGFRLRVAWLWQRPLPHPSDIVDQTSI